MKKLVLIACVGCGSGSTNVSPASPGVAAEVTARTTVEARSGSAVAGQLVFKDTADGVHITGEVSGLAPNSTHGFHVHEKGDCSAPDGSSAGGHYNPHGHAHGDIHAPASHAGDLGNLVSDAAGIAKVDLVKSGVAIDGSVSYRGRSVIVHANADDLATQPTGNAGGRIGCGVIQ